MYIENDANILLLYDIKKKSQGKSKKKQGKSDK